MDLSNSIEEKRIRLSSIDWETVKAGPWGYGDRDSLTDVVYEEVPSIVKYETLGLRHVFLWPDRPQLYTMTVIGK